MTGIRCEVCLPDLKNPDVNWKPNIAAHTITMGNFFKRMICSRCLKTDRIQAYRKAQKRTGNFIRISVVR